MYVPTQTKPRPPSARQLYNSSQNLNSTTRSKPPSIDRATKLDKLATKIMAAEAMTIITKAYEDVFYGSQGKIIGDSKNVETENACDRLSSFENGVYNDRVKIIEQPDNDSMDKS